MIWDRKGRLLSDETDEMCVRVSRVWTNTARGDAGQRPDVVTDLVVCGGDGMNTYRVEWGCAPRPYAIMRMAESDKERQMFWEDLAMIRAGIDHLKDMLRRCYPEAFMPQFLARGEVKEVADGQG